MVNLTLLYAKWCHVCPSAIKHWEDLISKYDFDYNELNVDSEKGHELISKYSIRGVPTTIIDSKVVLGVPDRDKTMKAIS